MTLQQHLPVFQVACKDDQFSVSAVTRPDRICGRKVEGLVDRQFKLLRWFNFFLDNEGYAV